MYPLMSLHRLLLCESLTAIGAMVTSFILMYNRMNAQRILLHEALSTDIAEEVLVIAVKHHVLPQRSFKRENF